MTARVDILAERETLRKPLLASAGLHAAIIAALVVQGVMLDRPRELWGDPSSLGGGSVGITPVSQIPLPSRGGPLNPLARDTESQVPEPPAAKKQAKRAAVEAEAAVVIKGRTSRPASQTTGSAAATRLPPRDAPNQVFSSTGQALSSPMVAQTGSGGVGLGPGGAFGNRFGYYRDLLEQAVARRWRTSDVDPRLRTAPPVIVTFIIRRNGSIADLRIEQSSGDRTLDYSALRAIYEASPFPPLPAGYERNEAKIEFWFQLKR